MPFRVVAHDRGCGLPEELLNCTSQKVYRMERISVIGNSKKFRGSNAYAIHKTLLQFSGSRRSGMVETLWWVRKIPHSNEGLDNAIEAKKVFLV